MPLPLHCHELGPKTFGVGLVFAVYGSSLDAFGGMRDMLEGEDPLEANDTHVECKLTHTETHVFPASCRTGWGQH